MEKTQFSVKLEDDCIARIRDEGKRRDRSLNYLAREALLKAFPEKKKGGGKS